ITPTVPEPPTPISPEPVPPGPADSGPAPPVETPLAPRVNQATGPTQEPSDAGPPVPPKDDSKAPVLAESAAPVNEASPALPPGASLVEAATARAAAGPGRPGDPQRRLAGEAAEEQPTAKATQVVSASLDGDDSVALVEAFLQRRSRAAGAAVPPP